VRVHDLRHSFASVLASGGASLLLIGQLLGHTQAATTLRYSHLLDSAQRDAVHRAGAVITGNGNGASVVPLRTRG
jgi:site-specific recombinase XerD